MNCLEEAEVTATNKVKITSVVNNVKLPELNFDSEESDTEDVDIQPVIFHPHITKDCLSEEAAPNSDSPLNEVIHAKDIQVNQTNIDVDIASKLLHSDESTLIKPEVAEIELDFALSQASPKKNGPAVNVINFGDSSSSNGSSILDQLDHTMMQLKEEKEREKENIEKQIKLDNCMSPSPNTVNNKQKETHSVDLREYEVKKKLPVNLCVVQRYGRNDSSNDLEDELNIEDQRNKIKEESKEICSRNATFSNRKLNETHNTHKDIFTSPQEEKLNSSSTEKEFLKPTAKVYEKDSISNAVKVVRVGIPDKPKLDLNDEYLDSSRKVSCVNDMLENVNRMIYEISEPKDNDDCSSLIKTSGEVLSLYENADDDDMYDDATDFIEENEEEEYVQNYTIFSGDTSFYEQDGSIIAGNEIKSRTKVVEWSNIMKDEQTDPYTKNLSPVKSPVKAPNVFDSLFTTSFISAANIDVKTKPKHIDTSPKKDILGKKKGLHKEKTEQHIEVVQDSKRFESCNKKYVAGLYTSKYASEDQKKPVNKEDYAAVLNTVEEFKNEIHECIKHEENLIKSDNVTLSKLTRQLNFGNNYINMTNHTVPTTNDNNCLACAITNIPTETPLKHHDKCLNYLTKSNDKSSKSQSVGVSTNDLMNYVNKENEFPVSETKPKSKNKKKKKKNKKVNGQETEENVSLKNDKNVLCNGDISCTIPSNQGLVNGILQNGMLPEVNKTENQLEKIELLSNKKIKEKLAKCKLDEEKNAVIKSFYDVMKSEKEAILFDEASSFESCYKSLPDTNKQLLMLKIPLESPGVCKGNANDSKLAMTDLKNSDNFIGLVSLFILLLQGSKWDIQSTFKEVPFDVVSLQQCQLDDELLLLVGVAENSNTYHYKTKRTKLGSSFFHAVSYFLNNTQLEDILAKMWQHIQQQSNQWSHVNIWQQLHFTEKSNILGSGKLSSFINAVPDLNALRRILSIPASIKPKSFIKTNLASNISEKIDCFHSPPIQQEYTCINIDNIVLMTPRHIIEFFKRLRSEAIELCAMRIGYAEKDKEFNPILCIGINEVDAANVEEGKILLSDCEQLKKIAISFQNIDSEVISVTNEPIIKYSLNKNRSFRKIVQWFGPNFQSIDHLKSFVTDCKPTSKITNTNGKNSKRTKPQAAITEVNINSVPLITTSPTYGVLFVSVALRSTFLAFIISLAGKKGLQLKSFIRTSFLSNQLRSLGMSELQIDTLRHCQRLSQNNLLCGFNVLLFHGNSAIQRLHGLIDKLTFVMNNHVTGETINKWTSDKIFHIKEKSHNSNSNQQLKRMCAPQDYFAVLNIIESTQDLFKTTNNYSFNSFSVNKFLSDVSLNRRNPSLNLICFVLCGEDAIRTIPNLLKLINAEHIIPCLNSSQKIFTNINKIYESIVELLGIKYLTRINKQQVESLTSNDESDSPLHNEIINKNVALLIFKAIDEKVISSLKVMISDYFKQEKLDSKYLLSHTDESYIQQLIFQYFDINEIFVDNVVSRNQMPPVYLPEQHQFFTIIDKVYDLGILKNAIKKDLSKNENLLKSLEAYSLPVVSTLHGVNISDLSYPLQLLFSNTSTYAGYSVNYRPDHAGVIIKVLARFVRMGFVICGIRFPVYEKRSSSYQLHVGLMRQDAIVVLNKMMVELESSYQMLKSTVTETVNEVKMFFLNQLKCDRNCGGLFYCNYWSIIEKLNFEKDDAYDSRTNRMIEWNPQTSCISYEYDYMKEESVLQPTSLLTSTTIRTHEVSVVLITEPLISGKYLGEKLPLESTFLQFWSMLEKIGYCAIGLKMTCLAELDANELLDTLDVDIIKRKRMVKLLSNEQTPFIAVALLGSCVISNIWIQLERNVKSAEAIEVLKKHTLVPSTRKQAESLLTSLFTQVYPNAKLALQTMMS